MTDSRDEQEFNTTAGKNAFLSSLLTEMSCSFRFVTTHFDEFN